MYVGSSFSISAVVAAWSERRAGQRGRREVTGPCVADLAAPPACAPRYTDRSNGHRARAPPAAVRFARGRRRSMARSDIAPKGSRLVVLAASCVVVAALWFMQDVLIPLALAVLITFLLTPIVNRLERWKLGR